MIIQIDKNHYEMLINSRKPVKKEDIIKKLPEGIKSGKITIRGPRNLWKDDIRPFWGWHLAAVLLTGGSALLFYGGFWLFEKRWPLYIVNIYIDNR